MLLTREQLQERLIAPHKASLELVKDVSRAAYATAAIQNARLHENTHRLSA